MRYAEGGRTRYYGGGVPRAAYTTPEQVLHVFEQLVSGPLAGGRGFDTFRRVVEVAADYDRPKGTVTQQPVGQARVMRAILLGVLLAFGATCTKGPP